MSNASALDGLPDPTASTCSSRNATPINWPPYTLWYAGVRYNRDVRLLQRSELNRSKGPVASTRPNQLSLGDSALDEAHNHVVNVCELYENHFGRRRGLDGRDF